MQTKININDNMSFKEAHEKHGLHGYVQIFRKNKETGEKSLWYEDDNIIPISGYNWILQKIFGLYLDSSHAVPFENIGQDTNLIIPDLNDSGRYQIGIDPDKYTTMEADISENHFIQGFMVGNGGAGEDAITTKNTDYSFTKLRNPIPFQQTQQSLDSSIAGKYLGVYRTGSSSLSKSYYIKKFDSRPHIYHSWWRDGQKWDYVDPVSQGDLGPDATNGVGKTNRIETYAQIELSINTDDGDCLSYFNNAGNNQTAMINELGLVAFDTVDGERSLCEKLYKTKIKRFITLLFDESLHDTSTTAELVKLANDIVTGLSIITDKGQSNINTFVELLDGIKDFDWTMDELDYTALQTELCKETNIGVEAFYNQNSTFIYATDKFLEYMSSSEFDDLTTDEAQRIKLITYYTFNSIPLQSNWEILINYRIYAN